MFKVLLSADCNFGQNDPFAVDYDSGPGSCKAGQKDLKLVQYDPNDPKAPPNGEKALVSGSFSFSEQEQTGPGKSCVYKDQQGFDTTTTFTVGPGKATCYQYFNDNLKREYVDDPEHWNSCDDTCKNILNLNKGVDPDLKVDAYSCVDDSVKTRYENCQNSQLTYASANLPQCVNDKITPPPADGCNFNFNNSGQPNAQGAINSHKNECVAGTYACLSGVAPKCQIIPRPVLSSKLLSAIKAGLSSGDEPEQITPETNIDFSVDRCVLPGAVKLLVNDSEVASNDFKNGKTVTFSYAFTKQGIGSYKVSATCNGITTPSNTITISVTDQAFVIQARPGKGDSGFYINHPFSIISSACSYIALTDSQNDDDVGGVPDHRSYLFDSTNAKWDRWDYNKSEKGYTYKKVGEYEIKGVCLDASDHFVARSVITLNVLDPASIQPKDLPAGTCEICPVDWPEYNGQKDFGHRCYSAERSGEGIFDTGFLASKVDYGQYKINPIRSVACGQGYECNHTVGCVVPMQGIEQPKQLCQDSNATLQNCKTGLGTLSTSPGGFVSSLLGILLSISGMIALYLIIRSGYQLMTSRGNPETIQEARNRLTSAIIGLLLIIFSLVIMSVIGVNLLKIPGFS